MERQESMGKAGDGTGKKRKSFGVVLPLMLRGEAGSTHAAAREDVLEVGIKCDLRKRQIVTGGQ
jgi:hypothetical protein